MSPSCGFINTNVLKGQINSAQSNTLGTYITEKTLALKE